MKREDGEDCERQGSIAPWRRRCCQALAQAQRPEPGPTSQTPALNGSKPNILVVFGYDIGITNLSIYSNGLMGYETPNIDRIGREGIQFLHYYGEQSRTAGQVSSPHSGSSSA